MTESSTTFSAIGQKLKTARESRNLSLRQVCERTKIPINHLQLIDDGNTDGLPEAVYVAGFIKRYADTVGLDGASLSDEFKRAAHEASASSNGKNNGKSNGNGRYPANQPVYVHPEYLNKARINTAPPTYKTWPFSFALVVLVLGIFTFLANQTNNNSNQQDPAVLSLRDSAQRTNTGPAGQTQTMPATNTGTAADAAKDGGKISLSANQHVWVEVKAVSSGESLYTGYLEQGDRRDFADPQGFRVRAGNGGSLSVDYKGKIETLGASGKVTERAFVAGSGSTPADIASSTTAPTKTAASSSPSTPRVIRTKPTSPKRSTPSYRSIDDSRSIDSGGGGGTRSIDVPYRYDGRLDSD